MSGFVIAIIVVLIVILIAGGIGLWIYLSRSERTESPIPQMMQEKTGRKYTFFRGQDGTWVGKENAMKIAPFVSIDDSNKTCDSLSGCVGWVRYSGNSYYRPTVITPPVAWDTTYTSSFPDDGTYLANE